ncbi:MAG: uridine diphosphate-N-acetylglucosamine-binding protein YvcK [Erysipelotrichaceae bacterium]|jgi:uncharacterized cofD-like protein|nr:uridine diphosphate-N-acetylglucosamine-binding protein YvcK [Erysipelotrichaceae bacterium]
MKKTETKKNVVVIGGGHGQATILKGLKQLADIDLTAIVTVADDGGSTGRLRRRFHIPAMGDIRNVMIALAKSETLLSSLMDYRFSASEEKELDGHNLGNLMLSALSEKTGSFMEAILQISSVLNVMGTIIPSTLEVVTLMAAMSDGVIVSGESNIPIYQNRVQRVFYNHEVKATRDAIRAVEAADVIILGIGSLYTSILPNLIIEDLRKALVACKAKKYYMCNVMTQSGETDHYSVEDHVDALIKHLGGDIDSVIVANDPLPPEILVRYEAEHATPVLIRDKHHDYQLKKVSLLTFENQLIRHDPNKIKRLFARLLKE